MSPYLPVCCLCLCVCLGVSACVSVCVSVSVWVCVSHVVGVCLTGISGGVRGCVHVCEPVNMSRLGATAPFPSGTIFPERRGTMKLAPAQPRTISLAPPFVGTVWREGVSGLGTQKGPQAPPQGRAGSSSWGNNHLSALPWLGPPDGGVSGAATGLCPQSC